jgi:hypothetical protein
MVIPVFHLLPQIWVKWSPGVTVDSRDVTEAEDEGERPLAWAAAGLAPLLKMSLGLGDIDESKP